MNRPQSAIGIDIGGTKIAAGLVTFPDGRVHSRLTIPTDPQRGGEPVLADTLTLAKRLADEKPSTHGPIAAIGIGICELVSPSGQLLSSNCIAWEKLNVIERLADLAPTFIEADVRAAALAEARFGAGRPFQPFVYVTIGTGISSCLVLDGNPFVGARGATGTIASSPMTATCAQCGAITSDTLEQIAAGPALVARFNESSPEVRVRTGEEVTRLAAAGNPAANSVIRSAGEALGVTMGLLVNVLDPQAIVVGGGLGLSGGIYWESLMASARKHIWSDLHRGLPILPAATGRDAGIIGAAAAAGRRVGLAL